MVESTRRRTCYLLLLAFLMAWELLHSLGVITSTRGSHPTAILLAFLDLDFLHRLLGMFLQVVVAVLLGGIAGTTIAVLIQNTTWLMPPARRFARIILWFPFFVIAALPQWWIQAISVILLIGIAAISAFSFYELLVVRTVLHFHWSEALSATGRKILLQSLLFSLYSQIHQRFGWMVLSVQRPELAYTALFLTCALLLLVDRAFESRFAKTAELDCKALVEELFSYKIGSLIGAFLLGLVCIGLWQFSSKYTTHYLLVDSPIVVFRTAYNMFIGSAVTTGQQWQVGALLTSLLEMFGGLIIGGALALIVRKGMNKSRAFREWMYRLLPMTYITPLILTVAVNNWLSGFTAPWRTALAVALLGFYPFLKVLWGLRDTSFLFSFVLGIEQALPFAFIGMLFGELGGATHGLGFFTVVMRAEVRINEAIAMSLFIFGLFVMLSASLRFVSKKLR